MLLMDKCRMSKRSGTMFPLLMGNLFGFQWHRTAWSAQANVHSSDCLHWADAVRLMPTATWDLGLPERVVLN